MKKIIAILLALAVVSMAFAQTVSISNTLKTEPKITIDGGASYWGFANNFILRDEVVGEAITADGRAKVKGRIRFDLQTVDPAETSILSFKPRWSWNSAANAADGNRSSVAASLRPWNFLQIDIGNLDDVGYAFGVGPGLSGNWCEPWEYGFNEIPGVAGTWNNIHEVIKDGLQVSYVGIDGLQIALGFRSADSDLRTMVKKGMFNGPALGAKYSNDIFEVGAKWGGNFGYTAEKDSTLAIEKSLLNDVGGLTLPANYSVAKDDDGNVTSITKQNYSYAAAGNDKAYQDHTLYAGVTFKGLEEAKIGTTIQAAVGFYTEKASLLKNANVRTTSFLFGVGAGFNFRNGIKDNVSVLVGYVKKGSDSAKVLPFCVTNNLSYTVDSDATFNFKFAYAQAGLKEKKSVQGTANTNAGSYTNTSLAYYTLAKNANNNDKSEIYTVLNNGTPTMGGYGWLIGAAPSFSWKMGASSFSFGVNAVTFGDIVPHQKSGWEWGWTGLRGRKATVSFPVSWTYTF